MNKEKFYELERTAQKIERGVGSMQANQEGLLEYIEQQFYLWNNGRIEVNYEGCEHYGAWLENIHQFRIWCFFVGVPVPLIPKLIRIIFQTEFNQFTEANADEVG